MPIFELRKLDAWGNAKDGFDINDSWYVMDISIPKPIIDKVDAVRDADNKALLMWLYNEQIFHKEVLTYKLESFNQDPYEIWLIDPYDQRPVYSLTQLEEGEEDDDE